jgi:hypothetical protein
MYNHELPRRSPRIADKRQRLVSDSPSCPPQQLSYTSSEAVPTEYSDDDQPGSTSAESSSEALTDQDPETDPETEFSEAEADDVLNSPPLLAKFQDLEDFVRTLQKRKLIRGRKYTKGHLQKTVQGLRECCVGAHDTECVAGWVIVTRGEEAIAANSSTKFDFINYDLKSVNDIQSWPNVKFTWFNQSLCLSCYALARGVTVPTVRTRYQTMYPNKAAVPLSEYMDFRSHGENQGRNSHLQQTAKAW